MLSFTLKHCEYFEAVAQHGGIAQAARALGISQPAVAQGLDRLEERTGLTLFHRRHARGADLTIQGRAFLDSVSGLLSRAREVDRDATALAQNLSGRIRLGCFHTLAPFCIAALVRGYGEMRPDAVLDTMELRHDALISALTTGQLDLALMYDMDLAGSGLELIRLARLSPRILLPSGHRLASHRVIHLRDLNTEPFILFEGAGSSDYFQGIVAEARIDPPIAMRCQSMESVRSAVANGLGFSFTTMRTASDLSQDGHRYLELPIADDVRTLDIVLARSGESADAALMSDFADFCGQIFQQMQ